MSAAADIYAFVRDVRGQIGIAEDAGADHEDCCIVFPTSYMAMAGGWPSIGLDGNVVVVVPKLWARDRCDEALAEVAYTPPDAGAGANGLWGFSEGLGSMEGLKGYAAEHGADWRSPSVQMRFYLDGDR